MRTLALVALAACGSSHHGADAGGDGTGSAIIDAPVPDVPFVKGTVRVTVTNASVAQCDPAQLHVVFVDVDQSMTDVIADAQGKAQADVFPGASATAVCIRASGTTIATTVLDVEPGDDLTLDGAYFFNGTKTADQTAAGSMKISFPANGSNSYTIETPCGAAGSGSATTNVAMPMKAGCQLATMDLVVTTQTQWTEAANVAFANNGSVTVTDTWHAMAPITASYANAPAFCADTASSDYPCDVQLTRYVPELHGHRTTGMTSLTSSGSVMVTSPSSSSAIMQSRLENMGPAYQVFTDVVDGTQSSYAIDFAAKALPWMCLGKPQCPTFSGTDANLTIPVTGTGAYDLFYADVEYVRGQQIFWWRVFGPTAGDVTYPPLPAAIASIRPTSADHQSVTHARICESDAFNGWRAARQNPFDSLATCEQSTNPTAPRYGGTHNRVSASQ